MMILYIESHLVVVDFQPHRPLLGTHGLEKRHRMLRLQSLDLHLESSSAIEIPCNIQRMMDSMSDWVNGVAAGATTLSAFATTGLAMAAFYQSKANKQQIAQAEVQVKVSEDQSATARESADAAVQLHHEAVRSRIDQEAPRVVALFERPKGPLVDSQGSEPERANPIRLLNDDSLGRSLPASSAEFVFDQDRDKYLWFHGRGLLVNEGHTSARVRLGNGQRFVPGASPLSKNYDVELPVMVGSNPPVAVLPPGGRALFEWAAGHTLREWAEAAEKPQLKLPGGSMWFWITVFDLREMGVIDTQVVHLKPDPLSRVPSKTGHWQVKSAEEFGEILFPLPTRRNYMHEGNSTEDLSQMHEYHDGSLSSD